MSANFPWDILGLEGPGDEADIRRAYARKLKTTRPDENPEGFQALVQAREFALGIASGAIVLHPTGTDQAPETQTPDAAAEPVKDGNPEPAEAEGREPPLFILPAAVPEPDKKRSDEELAHEKLQRYPALWDIETWQEVADLIGRLSFSSRQRIEPELVRAILKLNWEQACRNEPFGVILLSFSEEYGWEHDSMRLAARFGNPAQAGAFHDFLRHVRDIAEGRRDPDAAQPVFAGAETSWRPAGEKPKSAPAPQTDDRPDIPWRMLGFIALIIISIMRFGASGSHSSRSTYNNEDLYRSTSPGFERQSKDDEFIREPSYRRPARQAPSQ